MRVGAVALTVGLLVVGCATQPTSVKSTGPSVLVVFTTWAPDSKVTSGPEPGYKPALTGLTGHDIQTAVAGLDASGTSWLINIRFKQGGATHFTDLTRQNVAACPGDPNTDARANCAQRHLAIWLDLTQADIDEWENQALVVVVSRPFDLACLQRTPASSQCPKLVTDPITIEPITGGQAQIAGGFTEQTAKDLAKAIA